jgi:predicted Zn-dependent protease
MKRHTLLVASIVTTLLTAAAALVAARPRHNSVPVVSSASGSLASTPARAHNRSRSPSLVAGRDAGDVKRRLKQAEPGTYIGEVLLTRDSALARWHDRLDRPMRVWIQPSSTIKDWDPTFVLQVRAAFMAWSATGIPVHFRFVSDSSRADARVVFIDHFSDPISGKTRWARDDGWWIVDADVTLAVHHDGGETLDPAAVRAIALHEVGHLLGLDHTSDIANIMTPRVRVRELSNADRSTMKLLYTLPPGPVR